MANGLPIDLDKVEELEKTLDIVLAQVEETLQSNPIIAKFQRIQYKRLLGTYVSDQTSKMKTATDLISVFKPKDMNHRSYFMHVYAEANDIEEPLELLPTGIPKWTAKDAKPLTTDHPVINRLLAGTLDDSNNFVSTAMQLLAQHKADIYNKRYLDNIADPKLELPKFNPASSTQKRDLFDYLGLKSEAVSKDSGEDSWNRAQIERINAETEDPDIKDFTQAFIDHSFGAIVKNNFIKSFYEYTLNGRLYGSLKIFGAKSLTKGNLKLPSGIIPNE